ncbi:MAG: elongation factor Ts [Gammaproteobacteria bacterium TMED182]|jgi:elongation factor Ts|nr:elongation factor Ts [Gammaproteobacteria bacterium]RPG55858.1 MAG: elongation factor Ts [Gammaproteobacteria bacterium TMED182]
MAAVTAAMVKELRERTGLGMMDCKKALVETEGDMDQAIDNLRKSSGMKAAKKAGRIAADGLIQIMTESDKGIMVEVNCETDFAAKDANFIAFAQSVSAALFESEDLDVAGLMASGMEATREALVQKIGENCSVRRAARYQGQVASYLHTNGKIGVLVNFEGGDENLGKDLAMHIAAANPQVVSPENAGADVLEKEREIYTAQAAESGKPPEIVAKMVEGRIKKYLAEISLTEQAFVKDTDQKISALLKQHDAKVLDFSRFEVGEGIEKEEVDFAAEVAQQLT